MRRILVIGCGGSGKSALAKRLALTLGVEVIHLDAIFWNPGWKETPREEWAEIARRLSEREAWVMDGNYGGTMDLRIAAADTVIFLDFPTSLCLWRVIKRRFEYAGKTRPDMAPGCSERLSFEFLRYIWRYRKTRRPRILEKLRRLPEGKRAFVLRSPAEAHDFLDSIETSARIPAR